MNELYIYRNTAVEYLFKQNKVSFSGYAELSMQEEKGDIVFLYFLPYEYDRDKIVNFVQDCKQRILYLQKQHTGKPIYAVSLYNYFYRGLAAKENAVEEALHSFWCFLTDSEGIVPIDITSFYQKYGTEALFDAKYYYMYNAVLNPQYSAAFEAWLTGEITKYKNPRKKCLVLDLDDTLWGGILGEDGIANLKISGSYPGNCYHDFQQLILELKKCGVILCTCSKNNPEDVEECFQKRDDMLLQYDDFVLHSISWDGKAEGIIKIAEQLNIAMDSIVFVDDNPVEREAVKCLLPQVEVLDFPEFPYLLPQFFAKEFQRCFGIVELTGEDLDKTNQYRYKAQGEALKEKYETQEEFLRALQMKTVYCQINEYNAERFSQLTQKTNQFHLTGSRYTTQELLEYQRTKGEVYGVRVADKFGDLGITGVAVVTIENGEALIDAFLLSCRILGRRIEYEFLKYVMNSLYTKGICMIRACYRKSAKNIQTAMFYESFGFEVIAKDEFQTQYQYVMKDRFLMDDKYEVEEEHE